MKSLIYKEFRLSMHPTIAVFWALSSMLFIPNYPYGVVLFYQALGLFFVCLTGRENHDIEFTTLLPIRKSDTVKARFAFAVISQSIQLLTMALFAVLKNALAMPANLAGMDANVALFAMGFVMLGVFNIVFFTRYYKNPNQVGKAFIISSIVMFVILSIEEVCVFTVPFFRDRLDTPDPNFMPEKLAALLIGAAIYAVLTFASYRKSVKTFDKLDI